MMNRKSRGKPLDIFTAESFVIRKMYEPDLQWGYAVEGSRAGRGAVCSAFLSVFVLSAVFVRLMSFV